MVERSTLLARASGFAPDHEMHELHNRCDASADSERLVIRLSHNAAQRACSGEQVDQLGTVTRDIMVGAAIGLGITRAHLN
jgi:hypothetical protein